MLGAACLGCTGRGPGNGRLCGGGGGSRGSASSLKLVPSSLSQVDHQFRCVVDDDDVAWGMFEEATVGLSPSIVICTSGVAMGALGSCCLV